MASSESVGYVVKRADGQSPPGGATFLVLRLDAPENDLERLVARIFADLTTNRPLALAVFAAMGITGDAVDKPMQAGALYGGGKDAGLATGDSA